MRGALRVPEITAAFWVVKGLSTAMGEATSDWSVNAMAPQLAVLLGFAGFVVALILQFKRARYTAWTYWFAVVMVGVFGTMAADVLGPKGLGMPYAASSILYAIMLSAVFLIWRQSEKTLSIHSIDTPRREIFYWATVVATFAMGTALGDFTAFTLHLGYFTSAVVFTGLIMIPAVGYRWLRWNSVFSFWFGYVVTRPLGASIADGLGKSRDTGGLGLGDGLVAAVLGALILAVVAYLAITKTDVQRDPASEADHSPLATGRNSTRNADVGSLAGRTE